MSCTCTEDKFLYDMNTRIETPWDGQATGIIVGRNKVECQECIDARLIQEAKRVKDEEIQEKKRFLNDTQYKISRQAEQIAAGIPLTMSNEEYNILLAQRQSARDRINELEGS